MTPFGAPEPDTSTKIPSGKEKSRVSVACLRPCLRAHLSAVNEHVEGRERTPRALPFLSSVIPHGAPEHYEASGLTSPASLDILPSGSKGPATIGGPGAPPDSGGSCSPNPRPQGKCPQLFQRRLGAGVGFQGVRTPQSRHQHQGPHWNGAPERARSREDFAGMAWA